MSRVKLAELKRYGTESSGANVAHCSAQGRCGGCLVPEGMLVSDDFTVMWRLGLLLQADHKGRHNR